MQDNCKYIMTQEAFETITKFGARHPEILDDLIYFLTWEDQMHCVENDQQFTIAGSNLVICEAKEDKNKEERNEPG